MSKLHQWGVKPNRYRFVVLEGGIGDHFIFKHILPEVKEAHKDERLVMALSHPSVFDDDKDAQIISIAEARAILGDTAPYNVYAHAWKNKEKKHITQLYRELYI